jgi:hypothetical protein
MTTGRLQSKDVQNYATFARYAQQRLGTPYPANAADWARAQRKIAPLFEQYPDFDFQSLARVVDWVKSKNKRLGSLAEVAWHVTDAFREGALPEMEPGHREEDKWQEKLWSALETEADPAWRKRLLTAKGDGRKRVYTAWLAHYNESLLAK